MSLPQLTTDRPFLTDGGLETTLVFHQGLDLPDFAAFPLLDSDEGRGGLVAYYTPYLDLAERLGTGFVLDTPTWRANLDWGARLGYDAVGLAAVNHRAVEFVASLAAERPAVRRSSTVSSAPGATATSSGPRCGRGSGRLPRPPGPLVRRGRRRDDVRHHDDLCRRGDRRGPCGRRGGPPAVISFTVETDGRLPSGQPLGEAIAQVDDACHDAPAYYMVNCAHPTHFSNELETGARWRRGYTASGQRVAPEPRRAGRGHRAGPGDIDELGALYVALGSRIDLRVVGGCCGTDHEHVATIAKALDHSAVAITQMLVSPATALTHMEVLS